MSRILHRIGRSPHRHIQSTWAHNGSLEAEAVRSAFCKSGSTQEKPFVLQNPRYKPRSGARSGSLFPHVRSGKQLFHCPAYRLKIDFTILHYGRTNDKNQAIPRFQPGLQAPESFPKHPLRPIADNSVSDFLAYGKPHKHLSRSPCPHADQSQCRRGCPSASGIDPVKITVQTKTVTAWQHR